MNNREITIAAIMVGFAMVLVLFDRWKDKRKRFIGLQEIVGGIIALMIVYVVLHFIIKYW